MKYSHLPTLFVHDGPLRVTRRRVNQSLFILTAPHQWPNIPRHYEPINTSSTILKRP